jgi:hypothetical protein
LQHGLHQDYFPGEKGEERNGGQRFSYEIRLEWFNETGKDFDEGVLRRFHIRDIFMYTFQINFNFEYFTSSILIFIFQNYTGGRSLPSLFIPSVPIYGSMLLG